MDRRRAKALLRWRHVKKYETLFKILEENFPHFWDELAIAIEEAWNEQKRRPDLEARASNHSVTEIPEMVDIGSQCEPETISIANQTSQIPMYSKATQTPFWKSPRSDPITVDMSTQTGQDKVIIPRAYKPAKTITEDTKGLDPSNSNLSSSQCCWNCRSLTHRYSNCDRPLLQNFCYRCGMRGRTLSNCEQCSEEWKKEIPRSRRSHDPYYRSC